MQPSLRDADKSLQKDSSCDPVVSLVVSMKDVKSRICQVLGIRDPSRVNIDSQLNGLGLDSLTNFEVRGLLEEDFGVTVASVDLSKMTLRDIIKLTSQSSGKEGEKDAITDARLSIIGEVSGSTVSVESNGEFTSQTSLATQSSAVSVMGQNE